MRKGCYCTHRRRHERGYRYVHVDLGPQYIPHTKLTCSDNTNADPETRAVWVMLAQKLKVPIRCVLFTATPKLCEHNDTFRALNLGPEVSLATEPLPVRECRKIDFAVASNLQSHYPMWKLVVRNIRNPRNPITTRRNSHANIGSPPTDEPRISYYPAARCVQWLRFQIP